MEVVTLTDGTKWFVSAIALEMARLSYWTYKSKRLDLGADQKQFHLWESLPDKDKLAWIEVGSVMERFAIVHSLHFSNLREPY